MEAAGIGAHSQTPPMSPHMGDISTPAVSVDTAAALDQDADRLLSGLDAMQGGEHDTELDGANRSDLACDCLGSSSEMENRTGSSASQCAADARDNTRIAYTECAEDVDFEDSNQECQQERSSPSHPRQPVLEDASKEAGEQENIGSTIGVRRDDEEDLDALMQELAELNPLRSPRPDERTVSLTPCPP
jgi:hypothetical protein